MLGRQNDWRGLATYGLRDWSRQFDEFRRDVDRVFFDYDRAGLSFGRDPWPSASVSDDGDAWSLRAELPGLGEKDIELTVTSESVSVRAERKLEPPGRYTAHRRERASYRVARTFTLPTKIDPERVSATMKNGVLSVKLHKAAEAQPRQVQVRSA